MFNTIKNEYLSNLTMIEEKENKICIVISLTKKHSPKLCDYISTQEDIKNISDEDNEFINITEIELLKIGKLNLQDEIKNAIDSPVCPTCGRKIDAGLISSYRNNSGCTSKVIHCADCHYLPNYFYFALASIKNTTDKYKKFFSNYRESVNKLGIM